jgi:hypothetical protein
VRPSRVGEAGFVITGNSGGASQVGYALTHYGLDEIVDVVIPTGGPPHSALAKSCMDNPAERGYWFDLGTRQFIDRGFGFYDGNGPAARQDSAFIPRWLEESHATGGNDYFHPRTRVHFIIGANDGGMRTIAADYYTRLRAEGTPFLAWELAPNTPHLVISTEAGRAALRNAIFGVTLTATRLENHIAVTVSGVTNFNYILQSSADLTNWSSVRTNRGPFTSVQTNGPNLRRQFFRALSIP